MEKYTLRDLASNKFRLLTDSDIIKIDDVESVNIKFTNGGKTVTIHVGPYDYFFNTILKNTIMLRIKTDLGITKTTYRFAI